jgi:hypothetical protein
MPKFIDLSGKKFGRLQVIKRASNYRQPSGKSIVMWECKCECGSVSVVSSSNLLSGNSKKCKCCNEKEFKDYLTNGQRKHGDSTKRLYRIWRGMKTRCLNSKTKEFDSYGGRGISICEDWKNSYETFREWALLNGYADDLTIDRKNVDGNYEPSNCRWISISEQQSNRRNCNFIEYKGEKKILKDWAKDLGIPYSRLSGRLALGWSIEDAFTKEYKSSFNRKTVRVAQIDCNTNEIITIYPSIKEASISVGSKYATSIGACLKGKQITAHGYRWERVE